MSREADSFDAPMTRAQKFQWHLERGIADGMRCLPASCDVASALELVASLQRQFEILRTTIESVDGEFRQRVHESGEAVAVIDIAPESDVKATAAALAEEFTSDRVCRPGMFLVTFHLLRQDADLWLFTIGDSTAVDRAFYHMLDDMVVEMLCGTRAQYTGVPGTGLQPAQLARQENGPEGKAERHEAREYLRQHYATAPAALHPLRGLSEVREGRFYRATLTLARADEIFAHILETTGRLPSAVALGVFASLMCWRADVPSCAVNVSVENRHTQNLRMAMTATAQRAPVALAASGGTLSDAISAAETALSVGYPVAGRYDPHDLMAERTAAEARRGLCLTPDLAFNFNPPLQGWTALLESELTGSALDDAAATAVEFKSTNETSYEYGASLSVRWSDTRTVRLGIHADTHAVGRGDCAAILQGIEAGLKESARGHEDAAVADIAESVRLRKAERHPREVRGGDIWYDLAEIENRLIGIDGVKEAQLFFGSGGNGRLTARAVVSDGSGITAPGLRAILLEQVRAGALAAIPDHYEIADGKGAAEHGTDAA